VFLVRGYGYCDYINGALARILRHRFEDVALFGNATLDAEGASHSLIRIRSRHGTFYADAWSDAAVWAFPDEISAQFRDRIPAFADVVTVLNRSLPGTRAELYRKGAVFNRYDFRWRLAKATRSIQAMLFARTGRKMNVAEPRQDRTEMAAKTNERLETEIVDHAALERYLVARIDQLFGVNKAARAVYSRYSDGCTEDFCIAARIFSQKH
jgi:hypothetical protein